MKRLLVKEFHGVPLFFFVMLPIGTGIVYTVLRIVQ